MNDRRRTFRSLISHCLSGVLAAALITLAPGCSESDTPSATVQNAANTTAPGTPAPAQLASNPAPDRAPAQTPPAAPQAPAAGDELPPSAPPPPIQFEPPSLEFGIISPGENRTGTVHIRNMSDQPLRIAGSRSSCKCTAVDLANVVIPPHETVPLTATMTPDIAVGPKKAKIRVAFEGNWQIAEVDINAEVSLPVRCEPAYLQAVRDEVTGEIPLTGTFRATSLDGKPFRILSSNRKAPDFVDFDPAKDEPRSEYTIRWDLTQYDPNNCDEWPGWWVIETDHAGAPVVDLRIRHMCTIPKKPGTRRWFVTSQRTLVGVLKPGEPYDFSIHVLWAPAALDHEDQVIVAVPRTTDFNIELLGTDYTQEEPEIKLRVTPRADLHGLLFGTIELHSLQGHMSEHVLIGHVE